MKTFMEIIEAGAALAHLPYVPASQMRGEARTAVGFCVLYPVLVGQLDMNFTPKPQDPVSPVIYERDPLGAFLGYKPVTDWHGFWSQVCQHGLRKTLERNTWQNSMLQKFGDILLKLAQFYCVAWVMDITVDGICPIHDETVLTRLRCLRRILDADGSRLSQSHNIVERQLNEICVSLVRQRKCSTGYFPLDLFSPKIRKRKKTSTLAARLARRSGVSDEKIDRTMVEVKAFEVNAELSLPPIDEAQRKLGGGWKDVAAVSHDGLPAWIQIPFPTGGNHDLTRAELERIITDLSANELPEELKIIKLLCFCFLHPRHAWRSFLDATNRYLCGKVSVPNHEPTDPLLHRQRSWGDIFLRPIPASLRDTKTKIDKLTGEELERLCDETLRKNYETSWAKLCKALTLAGPDMFGYSWVLPHTGFNPDYRCPTGPQAYVHINDEVCATAEPYWQRLENCFQYVPFGDFWATGTNRCPQTEQVRNFFRAWKNLLTKGTTSGCSEDEAVIWHNAIASGAHMLVLLFCGLRPYRMMPLPLAMVRDPKHWRLICQKKPFAWTLPDCVRPLLADVHDRLICMRREFALKASGTGEHYAYEIYQKQVNGWIVGEISLGLITEALLHFPELGKFASLAPTWHRCFTNTFLRAKGIDELTVRDFHGHYDSVANPLRIHSLNPVSVTGRNLCANLIFKELEL